VVPFDGQHVGARPHQASSRRRLKDEEDEEEEGADGDEEMVEEEEEEAAAGGGAGRSSSGSLSPTDLAAVRARVVAAVERSGLGGARPNAMTSQEFLRLFRCLKDAGCTFPGDSTAGGGPSESPVEAQ
jgi:hypothetical protein